ncbi:MAG: hypothetical protein LBC77_04490 [Spirochaetaceae bacterium]|nr:hypothetical protein [Spirochaetaceae bacterium]
MKKALSDNPAFNHKELLASNEPFYYLKPLDTIIRKGDFILDKGLPYAVSKLIPKKLSLSCDALTPPKTVFRFNQEIDDYPPKITFSYKDFSNQSYELISAPDKKTIEILKLIGQNEFYAHENPALQEKFYFYHAMRAKNNAVFYFDNSHLNFDITDEWRIAQCLNAKKRGEKPYRDFLNPFNPLDAQRMRSELSENAPYYTKFFSTEKNMSDFMQSNLPEFYACIHNSIKPQNDQKPVSNTFENFGANVQIMLRTPLYANRALDAARDLYAKMNNTEKHKINSFLEKNAGSDAQRKQLAMLTLISKQFEKPRPMERAL